MLNQQIFPESLVCADTVEEAGKIEINTKQYGPWKRNLGVQIDHPSLLPSPMLDMAMEDDEEIPTLNFRSQVAGEWAKELHPTPALAGTAQRWCMHHGLVTSKCYSPSPLF